MAALKEGQYVWVCNWTWQRKEDAKPAKEAKKPAAKKGAKAAEDAVVDDVQELTRVAAKVQTVGPPYIVRPEWGKICPKCAKLAEYGPQSQPATIEVSPDGLSRGEAYIIAMQESNIKGRQDMVDLDDLKVGELMHNLRLRYTAKPVMKYYTYVGEILIVMNPMENVKDETGTGYISEEYMHRYSGKPLGDPTMEPHIYAIGDEAYRLMIEHKKSQSVVISGESGAGKSESTKHVLGYIAHCSEKNGAKTAVNDMILATSELLEAFGNAKTKRNHNSSRFGKFVEIQFDGAGGIVGAKIEQYLLESSRITSQEATERGYHVFYMMIVNLPADVKRKLYLTEVKDYRYMRGPAVEGSPGHFENESNWDKRPDNVTPLGDDEKWHDLIPNMNILGLGEDFQLKVWSLMAGVLQLGQIQFSDAGANKPCNVDNMDAVAHAAELLGLNQDALMVALRQKKIMTTMKSFTLQQARDNVDAMAKAIYSKMFVSLVDDHINSKIHAPGNAPYFIGVLDIFGFESFQDRVMMKGGKDFYYDTKNKFEQLCINLTNEQLQAFFYNELIPKQKKKYDAEQISISNIYYADNTGCLNLISVGKSSLFGVLNDVTFQASRMDQPDDVAMDKKWLTDVRAKYKESSDNVDNKHRKSKPHEFLGYMERDMKTGKMLHETDFCVYHYAGQVWYTTRGAVDRNKDDVSIDLNILLSSSTSPLLAPLFSATPDEKKASMVSTKFKDQLDGLTATLSSTEPFFVRCVKPNCIMAKGGYLEDHKVLEQLICAGMYAVIEMRQNGYPVERFPEKFVEEFKILEDDRGKLQGKGSAKDQAKYLCELCVAAYPKETSDRDGMAPFQVGVTKIFMKDNMAKALQLMKATAEALLKKKQAVAFGHIKALYLHWKEMKLLPERKVEAAKLAVKFARKRQLISEGKTPEEAERIIEEERIAEEKRIYEEYKAARYAPVEADYKPTMAPIADIMKTIDEFVAQPMTRKSPPELPQELRARKAAIWECSQKLQAAFAKFTANIKDEVAEGESKELIAQLKKLSAAERDNMERDKQRRQKEIADIAEEERLEKERLERLRKELEEKKRREEEARRREEEERIANAGRLAIEQEKGRIRKEREDKRNERLQRKEQILAEREAQRAEEQRHRDEERERLKKEHAREEREKAKMKKAQEKEDMMIHARSEALTSTHVKYEDMECEIKYYGRLPYEGSGDFVGIQAPKPCGEMNDGTLLGVKLFECVPGLGKFVRPKMLHIISPATGRLEEGNMVWVRGTKHVGEVMWVGEPDFAAGQWVGIKLEKPGTGKNNGTINGTFYFKCPELTGVFVRPASLAAVEPFTESFVRSLTERYITMNNLDDFSDDEDSDMEAHLNQVAAQAEELTRKQVDAARKAELAAAPPAEMPM